MWEASLNLAISIQSSSSLASSTADGRLAPPNLAVISFGRRSSSDKHPASSNSFMIGLSACTKASAFLLGTRYKTTGLQSILYHARSPPSQTGHRPQNVNLQSCPVQCG